MPIDLSRLRHGSVHDRRPWHGSAFIVEALVLLVFLIASLAVLMQVIGGAHERGEDADRLSNAIILASNDAETFAADPTAGDLVTTYALVNGELIVEAGNDAPERADRYDVTRTVQAQAQQTGTLYEAHIEVTSDDVIVYQVDTARYVSNEGVQR